MLGRALSEHLSGNTKRHFASLETTAQLYQDVRLPRAQKTQATSRAAGNTYEMQAPDMLDLSFDECIPLIAKRTADRMKWVWEEDLDAIYERARDGEVAKVADATAKQSIADGAIPTGQGEAIATK